MKTLFSLYGIIIIYKNAQIILNAVKILIVLKWFKMF